MNSEIRFLIERYYQVQEHRIATGNQVKKLEENDESEMLIQFYERFHELERDIEKYVSKEFKRHEMYEWLKDVKGIGPILGASLISYIDIEKAQHASSVWKFCGLAVNPETGEADRKTKGQKIAYSPFMRTQLWKIGESFVKQKGEYRTIYDTSREFYNRKFPNEVIEGKRHKYNRAHLHAMAKRRTVKIFLSRFWAEWREKRGLPVSEPFAHR
jgi:hypothetical protein